MASWVAAINREHELLLGDEPQRRMVGFYDHTDEQHHLLKITNLQVSFQGQPFDQRQMIQTAEGRKKLLGVE